MMTDTKNDSKPIYPSGDARVPKVIYENDSSCAFEGGCRMRMDVNGLGNGDVLSFVHSVSWL